MDRLYANLGLFPVTSGHDEVPDVDAAHLRDSMRQIEAAMTFFNLAPSSAHLAAEIAAFEDDLTAAQRVALIMLIASSIVALNEGSTRLPVTGPAAHGSLARIRDHARRRRRGISDRASARGLPSAAIFAALSLPSTGSRRRSTPR
jgi:hypothetical protein